MPFGNVTEGGSFEHAPPGTYAAHLVQMIDLGTQTSELYGAKRKVVLSYELSKTMDDGRPYMASRWFSLTLHRKGSLRPFIENWLGRQLSSDEIQTFGPNLLADIPALVTVMHKENGAGETRAQITSVSSLPEGMPCPDRVNELIAFDLSHADKPAFEALSPGIQDIIKRSPEFLNCGLEGETPPSEDSGANSTLNIA